MVNCEICKILFPDDKSLHAHLKVHKLHVFEYYQQVSPRYDLNDGSMICFKNKKQYFETDFNSVRNMRLWLDKQGSESRKKYLKWLIIKRKDEKSLKYSLSQVELRSLKVPGINYLNSVFGDYYDFCKSLGFENRYVKRETLDKRNIFKDFGAKILIDSREQMPLSFACKSEVTCLKFGDYAFSAETDSKTCYVERKSLNDFVGTLSGGFDRFEREIVRAKEANAYLVVLVEDALNDAVKFNTLDEMYKRGMKITPEYVFHNVRSLIQKYDHLQFLFVKDREEASKMVEKLFCYGEQLKTVDLQLMYDLGNL